MASNTKYRTAVERSLTLHREVASRIREKPALIDAARRRVQTWLDKGAVSHRYATEWADLLRRPTEELLDVLLADTEFAQDLRQVSPFAGVLDARTRWRLLRGTRGSTPP